MSELIHASEQQNAAAIRRSGHAEEVSMHGSYRLECRGPDGALKWTDTIENLVTTEGKNILLDTMFGPTAATPWYLGLIATGGYTGPAITDTMLDHAGWGELTNYSNTTRVAAGFAAAALGEKALTLAAEFNMSAYSDVTGCFLTNDSTKGGTLGTLYSAGAFISGSKLLDSGDTLTVMYTAKA